MTLYQGKDLVHETTIIPMFSICDYLLIARPLQTDYLFLIHHLHESTYSYILYIMWAFSPDSWNGTGMHGFLRVLEVLALSLVLIKIDSADIQGALYKLILYSFRIYYSQQLANIFL